jgi:ferredoxin
MTFRVKVDQAKCIGCLACNRCDNFLCGNDFKAHTARSEVSDIGCNQQAAEICPVSAISISITDPDPSKSR